jgi:hypothetical protein
LINTLLIYHFFLAAKEVEELEKTGKMPGQPEPKTEEKKLPMATNNQVYTQDNTWQSMPNNTAYAGFAPNP